MEHDPQQQWRKARSVLASGVWSITQGAEVYPDDLFPLLAKTGTGCRLRTTDGRELIDWSMAWGAAILGHRAPEIEAAIVDQLRATGPILSLFHPLEADAARLLRTLVPCADYVAFGKNGSDPLTAAVRIARTATGRDGVVHCGFHGSHDWFAAGQPTWEGVPEAWGRSITSFPYNDLPALTELFTRHPDGIAAVVLDPAAHAEPVPGFLEGVRELTLDHGAIMVFDEVVTGFRLACGGAQEAYGVTPDLACFGKAIANGMPLSALTGKRDLLEILPRVGYGMTFRGELLSIRAAITCMSIVRDTNLPGRLADVGRILRAGFSEAAARIGVDAVLSGPLARQAVRFRRQPGVTPAGLRILFIQECLTREVLTNGLFLPSRAHDDAAIARTVAGFDDSLEVVARAIEARDVAAFLRTPELGRHVAGGE